MTDEVTLKITLPKIPDIELVAIEGLDRLARHLGIAEEKIGEARILVAESLINAFEHSGDPHLSVRVEFTMTKRELTVFVRDYGKGFDLAAVDDPDIQAKLGAERKRGWGLKVMKSLSDDFHIESTKQGTKIIIRKLLT